MTETDRGCKPITGQNDWFQGLHCVWGRSDPVPGGRRYLV
jgi:hypothetical protein